MYYDYIWTKLRNVLIEKFNFYSLSRLLLLFLSTEKIRLARRSGKDIILSESSGLKVPYPSRLASIRGARLQGRCDVPHVTLNVASCQRSVTSSLHSCFTHRVNHVTFALGIIPLDSNNSRIIIFFSNLPIFLYDRSNATISSPSSIILE